MYFFIRDNPNIAKMAVQRGGIPFENRRSTDKLLLLVPRCIFYVTKGVPPPQQIEDAQINTAVHTEAYNRLQSTPW